MPDEKQAIRILLAEENLADAFLFQTVLGSDGFSLDVASTLSETIKLAKVGDYDIVLLNLSLPDSTGLDTLSELIRCVGQTPVVALTGVSDIESGPLAIRIGAQDFLAKTDATRSLLRLPDVIRNAIDRKRVLSALVGPDHRHGLTGLMKTGAIIDWVSHLLNRQGDPPSFAVVAMEFDDMYWAKKELGSDAEDIVLVTLTQRLSKQIRGYDMPAIIHPDELVVVLERIGNPDDLMGITERLSAAMMAPMEVHGVAFPIKAYCSAIYCGARGPDPQEIVETVCRSARASKESGNDTVVIHNASMIPSWNAGR